VSAVTAPARVPGVLGWAVSTDHKRIGLAAMATSFVFFAISGILAMVMRTELAAPGMQVVSRDVYNQIFTLHGGGMVYLFLAPFAVALGVYIVPLQVGAAEIVAPRLALLGFWLFALGGFVTYLGVLTQHNSAKTGWTAFFPLSDDRFTPGSGMDFWLAGTILATAGPILLALSVLATILRRRAPGMTMLRIPIFCWSMLVTVLMVITSFPVLVVAFSLLLLDRHGIDVYESTRGQLTYQHLYWFYSHPVVYVMFFPFVGAVGEVFSTFGRRPFFGYKTTAISLLVFAALSMSVWGHHMFTTGQVQNEYFSLTSTLLSLPAGAEYFALVGTLIGASLVFSTATLFGIGFVLLFVIGGLSGIMTASPPIDYHVHDSYFVVAHFHYTLFAGSMFGLLAGLYYWWPKATGWLLGEGLGKLQFALLFVGTNLTFFPQFLLGYDGMPRRVATYPEDAGWTTLNVISTIGSYVVGLGMLVLAINIWRSWRARRPAGSDPWGGNTLEWWTTSPPPRFNFDRALPPIKTFTPLLDLRKDAERDRA
jgi:cytochrome c oxidase subunit 1